MWLQAYIHVACSELNLKLFLLSIIEKKHVLRCRTFVIFCFETLSMQQNHILKRYMSQLMPKMSVSESTSRRINATTRDDFTLSIISTRDGMRRRKDGVTGPQNIATFATRCDETSYGDLLNDT